MDSQGRQRVMLTIGLGLGGLLLVQCVCWAEDAADPDQQYAAKFVELYPKVESPATLETYAMPARYDDLYMGDKLDKALEPVPTVANDNGGVAWGLASRMDSLNLMHRATGDVKYLEGNLECIRAVLDATDDKRGIELWTGVTVPAWGCTKYAKRGRAVFAVHTGIITAPMFDLLLIANKNAPFRETLADESQAILEGATKALAVHDRQWRDGPGEDEGHYIGLDQEEVCENKPLPGNRLSAMGWALWLSWKLTGNETHRDCALAIGRYIKHRLTPSPDGAYYWPYWLPIDAVTESRPRESVPGEDSSHAGLTMQLPFVLHADGQVFSDDDMKRLANMVTNGLARLGGGILFGNVTGTPNSRPGYVGEAARWLYLAQFNPEVQNRVLPFYLNYKPTPGPRELSRLILMRLSR